jgi:hypothetical protein
MLNAFWWGHSGAHNKGIHWLSWDKLSMVSKISQYLIWQCWVNRAGASGLVLLLLLLNYTKQDIFQSVAFLILVLAITRVLSGGVFVIPNSFLEQVIGGELAMVTTFRFGMRIG